MYTHKNSLSEENTENKIVKISHQKSQEFHQIPETEWGIYTHTYTQEHPNEYIEKRIYEGTYVVRNNERIPHGEGRLVEISPTMIDRTSTQIGTFENGKLIRGSKEMLQNGVKYYYHGEFNDGILIEGEKITERFSGLSGSFKKLENIENGQIVSSELYMHDGTVLVEENGQKTHYTDSTKTAIVANTHTTLEYNNWPHAPTKNQQKKWWFFKNFFGK